jgi:hypothetical protein
MNMGGKAVRLQRWPMASTKIRNLYDQIQFFPLGDMRERSPLHKIAIVCERGISQRRLS